jgi:ZIP family zinc transporter
LSFEQTVLLAAIAGGTIFLGLPVGRLRNLSPQMQAILTTGAGGVILFLIWDILSEAVEPVEESLHHYLDGAGAFADFGLDAAAFGLSIATGLLVTVWAMRRVASSRTAGVPPRDIALGTAMGLGLHNFSEGLAIGQSAATGATTLALILVIGFALHNATEGFGIAAPLSGGPQPSWAFLGLAGLIGGGPTFLGGVVGYTFVSPILSIVFLGLAAGALIFVFNEIIAVSRRFAAPMTANAALLVGLLAAFATDFLLVAAGA